MLKSKKTFFSKTVWGKWIFFYIHSRYIPKVYSSCLVRFISKHRRRIKLASFGRKYRAFIKEMRQNSWKHARFATKTRQFYFSCVCRNKTNQWTGIYFRYVSPFAGEKNLLSTPRFWKKNFFRFSSNSLRISRRAQISAQNSRKNACRAPSIKATRNLHMWNFCKIFICGDISMFRRLNS